MTDNPAQRLHALLTALRAQPGNAIVANALGAVLRADPNDMPTLLYAVAEVAELPAEVERQLISIPDLDHDLFLEWRPAVSGAFEYFKNMVGQTMSGMQAHYNDATLLGLRHASNQLRVSSARDIPDSQLDELLQSINELRELIETSDEVDGELQLFLLDLVTEMSRAVRFYRIHGVDGLEKALERSIGALAFRFMRSQPVPPSNGKVWRKIQAVLNGIGLAVGTANSSYELGNNVVDAIGQITS